MCGLDKSTTVIICLANLECMHCGLHCTWIDCAFSYSHIPSSPTTRNAGKVVTMSGGLDVLQMKEEDVLKFLAAGTHLGGTNLDFQMEQYVYKRKSDGECLKPVPSCMMSSHKVSVVSDLKMAAFIYDLQVCTSST